VAKGGAASRGSEKSGGPSKSKMYVKKKKNGGPGNRQDALTSPWHEVLRGKPDNKFILSNSVARANSY